MIITILVALQQQLALNRPYLPYILWNFIPDCMNFVQHEFSRGKILDQLHELALFYSAI